MKYEIVDGQQRIRSIVEYRAGKFPLLDTIDRKFRIPESLRAPARWGGKHYAELPDDALRLKLDELKLDVQMISGVSSPDEIRDLFIRLQSGTALTRQQVRDAWPGNIGPFIERVGGKMDKQPSSELFGLIDGRGNRSPDDEGDDPYSNDRATAAQLLTLFLARERSERNFVGISAPDLDALYHEQSSFNPQSDSAKLFGAVLKLTETLLRYATAAAALRLSATEARKKRKYSKLTVLAVFCWAHDFLIAKQNGRAKITEQGMQTLANYIQEFKPMHTKGQTGPKIKEVFEQFLKGVPAECTIDLDPKRDFSDDDKHEIKLASAGKCSRCGQPVLDGDSAYHHKEPWARGGRTVVENGTLMHQKCHIITHEVSPVRVDASF